MSAQRVAAVGGKCDKLLGLLSPEAAALVGPLAERPDLPDLAERLARMALIFLGRDRKQDARHLAAAARDLGPDDYRVKVYTQWLDRRQAPLWHFEIVQDEARNAAYARALEHFVRPGMTVFEIGTGTGILAMLAARFGADHVYTCERREETAAAARDIIDRNGYADRVTVIAMAAEQVRLGRDLPQRADLFVAEIVDNSLLGEQVLPLTELARRCFLTPDAILLPRSISARGCLASEDQRQRWRLDRVMGFDLSPFNRFSPLEISAGRGATGYRPLSEPIDLLHLDLAEDHLDPATERLTMLASEEGVVDGVLRWLRLDFGDGISFENDPPQESCWHPHFHQLDTPRAVRSGDSLALEVFQDRDRIMVWPAANS